MVEQATDFFCYKYTYIRYVYLCSAQGGGGVVELATDFMCYDDRPFSDADHSTRLDHYMRGACRC